MMEATERAYADVDSQVLDEIVAAWRRDTGWEQFGREVGSILASHGITAGVVKK